MTFVLKVKFSSYGKLDSCN